MHRFKNRVLLCATLLAPGGLSAYETQWNDPKIPSPESTDGKPVTNMVFKIDGQVFAGYEFEDHQKNGTPDQSGPAARAAWAPNVEPTGFTLNRMYVNFRGEVTSGALKGWAFRLAPDIARNTSFGLGCGGTGGTTTVNSCNNDYILYLKHAWVTIPLFQGAALRLGQQNVPIVAAQAGVNLEENWGQRFTELSALEYMGIASSADRGISFLYSNPYIALHMLLANGENFHKGNAQNLFTPTGATANSAALDALSQGTGDSYGLTMYQLLSFIPTGENKAHRVSINLPVRLENVYGMDTANEDRFAFADFATTPASPTYRYLVGDSRAKRDYSYGWETDYTFTDTPGSLGIGAGQIVKVDRRASAYIIDQTAISGVNPADFATIGSHMRVDQDAKGLGSYVYVHGRVGSLGFFARLIAGTSGDGSLTGALGSTSRRSAAAQALALPLYNNGAQPSFWQAYNPSTLSNTVSQSGWDPGLSRFRAVNLGLTWYATERFRVALGVSTLTGTDRNGQKIAASQLDRVGGNASGTGTGAQSLSNQLAVNSNARSALGLASTDPVNVNYLTGKPVDNKQVYVRSEFLW